MYSEITKNKRKTAAIMVAFSLLIVAIALLFSYLYQDFTFTIFAIVFAIGYALWGFYASSRLALTMNGAHEIQKRDNPRLWRTVENLSITEGLPMPKVYIIDDPGLNAFATGRDPKHASVAATSGLVDAMSDIELEGVMAHEIGHIKNFDIRVSMIAFAMVSVIGLLCDFFLRISFWGSFRGDGDGDSDNNNGILMLLGLVALILAPIVAMLLQMSISRKREYLADATGALTTRHPEGLADALEKIKDHSSTLRRQNSSTAHFFIANPLKGKSISGLFSTHPPIEDRIKILRGMDMRV